MRLLQSNVAYSVNKTGSTCFQFEVSFELKTICQIQIVNIRT